MFSFVKELIKLLREFLHLFVNYIGDVKSTHLCVKTVIVSNLTC